MTDAKVRFSRRLFAIVMVILFIAMQFQVSVFSEMPLQREKKCRIIISQQSAGTDEGYSVRFINRLYCNNVCEMGFYIRVFDAVSKNLLKTFEIQADFIYESLSAGYGIGEYSELEGDQLTAVTITGIPKERAMTFEVMSYCDIAEGERYYSSVYKLSLSEEGKEIIFGKLERVE